MTAEMERLRTRAGEEEYDAGVVLYRRGAVSEAEDPAHELCFWVDRAERRRVVLQAGARLEGRCDCPAYALSRKPCRHVVAALLYADGGGLLAGARQRHAREAGEALLRALEPRLPLEQKLRVDVQLRYRRAGGAAALFLALRVGMERLYVVRDLRAFVHDVETRTPVSFGKGFVLQPEWMRFQRVDERLLRVLRELIQATASAEPEPDKWLELPPAFAARVLRLLQARPFRLMMGETNHMLEQVWRSPLPVRMTVRSAGQALHLAAELPASALALTPDGEFVYSEESVLCVPAGQREVLRMLLAHATQGRADFRFTAEEAARVVSELLPKLARAGEVQLDPGLAHRIVRRPLAAEVYLDREGRGIVARVAFGYGELHIDPFAPEGEAIVPRETGGLLLLREAEAEQRVLEVLSGAGFHVRMGRVWLTGPEAVVRFCVQGVKALQAVAAVYCSPEFRRMEPRRPKLGGTLRMVEGALRLELLVDDQPAEDLVALMAALREHRRYFMLREGAVLDLSDLGEWTTLADALQEDEGHGEKKAAEADPHGLRLENYRAAHLTGLLGASGLPVQVEEGVQRLVDALSGQGTACPAPMAGVLRSYQEHGFQWLRALYQARMGGILADDMGLGKTLQVIALMLWIREQGGEAPDVEGEAGTATEKANEKIAKRATGKAAGKAAAKAIAKSAEDAAQSQTKPRALPVLVVAPSSLVYNWQAELAHFAPGLQVVVVEGPQLTRAAQIRAVGGDSPADVLITSYPLLRRDIAALTALRFSAAVLDEAQYIKNPASVSAVAAKQLRADVRLALTGTPMENHPGELWSLFDFVLPGYLGGLARFLHRHGAGQHSDALRRMTGPFLLRRLKRDVLTDLPDKIETRLLAEMTAEQRRVYTAALHRLNRQMDALLSQRTLQRGRMEVLSVLTELRQICCHPALCLPDYSASSGKMDLLMDVLPGALEAGRRVLVFSQFTSMLKLLLRRMEAADVACLYLDGDTPGKERMQLVNRFNAGEGQVFLISLRAGGSGLNLTGADMVVHYDPWWNPAAEDQATDRAHRIGQTKAVEVYRLITRNSIEEQVVRLSERKRALFEMVVDGGTQPAAQASDEELRALLLDLMQQGTHED